uniref:non-specific serine/threonine protein kinase n=1 Tax=Manihot esculenta TaxID=3983 RepID=A0A2C9V636_MANES
MIVLFLLFFLRIPHVSSLSFNFPSFDSSNHDINYEGDASLLDSVIQLTPNQLSQTGHATYVEPMHLWDNASGSLADFTASFSFSIDSQNNASHADGLAFFIVPPQYRMPDEKQGSGIGLASGNLTLNSTANPFVAVEFDTYYNPWDDMDDDHVGIDINSLKSLKSVKWYSSVMDGRVMDSRISYNSSSMNLCVYFTGISENIKVDQNLCYEVDLRGYLPEWVLLGFSGATGANSEFHRIHSWSFDSSFQPHKNSTTTPSPPPPDMPVPISTGKDENKAGKIAGVVIGSLGACVIVFLGIWYFRHKKKSKTKPYAHPIGSVQMSSTSVGNIEEAEVDSFVVQSQDNEFRRVTGAKKIPYEALICATNNFDENEKLGEGGFGAVFKGYLKDLRIFVAVKRIFVSSIVGIKGYAAEVMILSQLRHKNLVQLIGWCHERKAILLVYEYLENRSLDFHLYNEETLLKWEQRFKIAQGLASGLQYLHHGWKEKQCVLHRDIKPSNVMLDSDFNSKLGDFGLARLQDNDGRSQTLQGGSRGYIAPECWDTGRSIKESDVFSFGVVALEIACGRKPFVQKEDGSQVHIVEWLWEFYGRRKLIEAADPKLEDFKRKQMECLMIVGLWCGHPHYAFRPSMSDVIDVLNFAADPPELPPKFPGPEHCLYAQGSSTVSSSITATFITAPTQHSTYDSQSKNSNFTSPTSPLIMNQVKSEYITTYHEK